ncbi:MAG: hypothetical protein KKA60_08985, partial [Proteobacteria bacterium]|nr:hypothetical protein [Pseudomonadota bacterium]
MINKQYPISGPKAERLKGKRLVCSDSGGYQAYKCFEKGGLVLLCEHLKPGKRDKNLVLNPLDNCEEYARTHSTMGFMIDYPTIEDDDKDAFLWKQEMSVRARDMMIPLAEKICPDTEL